MNPGLSGFQSQSYSSYPTLPKDKDQGLPGAESRTGPSQQKASLWLWLHPTSLLSFPGAATRVKDAALGVLPPGPNPQQWLPLLLTFPDPQVSSSANRAWISITPKSSLLEEGCLEDAESSHQLASGSPHCPSLGGGQTLSSKEVVHPRFQLSLGMSRAKGSTRALQRPNECSHLCPLTWAHHTTL